ncbi:MAG: VWA domain-containing protein [Lachnospiraceae bacterium]|nr:VWA domain-containing protein [Lachnospiraceae bacterium]
MRRKALAAIVCLSLVLSTLLSACGAGNTARPGQEPPANPETAESGKKPETAPSENKVSEGDDIDARITAAGESYDGLYVYEEPDYDYNAGTTANSSLVGGFLSKLFGSSSSVEYYAADAGATAPEMETAPVEEYASGAVAEDGYYEEGYPEEPWFDPQPLPVDREGYNDVQESGFVSTKTRPFSTFGADVDTATYSNLRRTIFEGYGLEPGAIRLEELINYFDYDYPKPEEGERFSVTTALTSCPWNKDTKLLRIGVRAEEKEPENGSNIVFLIDTSGSMFDNNKLPLAVKAFKLLAKNLNENDRISIVTYAGNDEIVAEGLRGSDYDKIAEALDGLEAYGSTNGEGGINSAYAVAEKFFIPGGNNRVILATDGDLNVGVSSEAGLTELIEKKKESGVFLSCLGFGEGNYMDDKMEALADHGNGNYAYIDCTGEAKKVLDKELSQTIYTVAKDTKFQVEFNPAEVKGYRQIGYENRKMADEDFADDTKDGGEVGSGQTVTVLYEIVTKDSGYEIPEVASKYGNTAETNGDGDGEKDENSGELLTVNIRYKEPDGDTSVLRDYPVTADMYTEEMDDDTSWAAGVAQFGMLLRDSEYKGDSSYQVIYDRLKLIPAVLDDDYKAEFLYLVRRVRDDKDDLSEEEDDGNFPEE